MEENRMSFYIQIIVTTIISALLFGYFGYQYGKEHSNVDFKLALENKRLKKTLDDLSKVYDKNGNLVLAKAVNFKDNKAYVTINTKEDAIQKDKLDTFVNSN